MKKKDIGEIKDKKVILPVFMLGLGLVLFLLEIFNTGDSLKNGIHWISDPVTVGSENAGRSVFNYFNILANISGTQDEINDLRLKILKYESGAAYVSILEEENEALREQLNLGNKKHEYVEAMMLGKVMDNTIRINVGDSDKVKVGDTVSVGYYFVGIVMEVAENISTVRLPYSKSSTLEVRVVSKENREDVISKAVVRGSGEEYMIIENISKNTSIAEGDYVIVSDEKVAGNLVIGEISELSQDPASTSISGKVVPIMAFDDLISVFVCIE